MKQRVTHHWCGGALRLILNLRTLKSLHSRNTPYFIFTEQPTQYLAPVAIKQPAI
ncbi:hypothetical protein [Fischerella muscicola]|uniref:hypothetical protein n=1 Tax=Fischerella muscicola TaxID=92938 RepID=UPI0015E10738|nr:hypothetical protein [Fischerella muscicola]